MNIDSNIAILSITENGKNLACKIKSLLYQNNIDIYYVNSNKENKIIDEKNKDVNVVNKRLKLFVSEIFNRYEYIVFIMATGIVVRTIADLVSSKFHDPAILVTDEKGKNIISLLSGHMGGANEMTIRISNILNSNPVITTATDVNDKSSLDMIAKNLNAHIDNFRDNVLHVNSLLVNNKNVGIYIDGDYKVDTRGFEIIKDITTIKDTNIVCENLNDLEKIIVVSNKNKIFKYEDTSIIKNKYLRVIPKDIVVGIGCRKDIDSDLLIDTFTNFLVENNININAIKEIGSIEIKKNEKAIIDLSKYLNVSYKTFTVEQISKVDQLFEKSQWVKENVGVFSVAEPVAYLLSNENLIINKYKFKGMTFSVGRLKK